jgi:hypothetical protein
MITGEEGSDQSGKMYMPIELVKTTMTQPQYTIEQYSAIADDNVIQNRRR